MSSGQNPSFWAGTHKWKDMCLHELNETKCLSLRCLYFSLTCGPLLCSSGETVTSVTSMSPLQPKKVKKKKEKEKLEQPPAIPAKGMKRNAAVFQILSTTMKGQQSVGCQGSCTLPLTLSVRQPVLAPIGGERNGPCLLLGPGSHLPAALAIEKLVTESKKKVSAPTNQMRERNFCSNTHPAQREY